MKKPIKKRIAEAIEAAREANKPPAAYPYLSAIIEVLSQMENNVHADLESRTKMSGALGRLVTEDYAFSQSPLGNDLLEISDYFSSNSINM